MFEAEEQDESPAAADVVIIIVIIIIIIIRSSSIVCIHTYYFLKYKVGKTQLETWTKSIKLKIMSVMQMHNKIAA